MLTKAQIDALLAQQSMRQATEAERELLKRYIVEQQGEELQQFVKHFDLFDVSVTAECTQTISFTWRVQHVQQLHTLSDSYILTIAKKG